jgi:LEA14-like dessication related protein
MRTNFLWLVLGVFVLSSCIDYDEIKIVSVGKISLDNFEGTTAHVNVDVELENPNFFAIKIKPSSLDIYVEEEYLGKAVLLEKVKIKRNSVAIYCAKIQLQGEGGMLLKAMKYALRKEFKVRLTGYVKGSVYGIPKKMKVDETKTIDGRKLKLKTPFFN